MWYFNPPKWHLGNISRMNGYSLPEVVGEASRRCRPLGAENAFFCDKGGDFARGVPEMPIFMTDNPNSGP